jgi:hypothetical protein
VLICDYWPFQVNFGTLELQSFSVIIPTSENF